MQTLEALEARIAGGGSIALLPADSALQHLPAVVLDAVETQRLRQGQSVALRGPPGTPGRVRLYGPDASFLGMGEADSTGRVQPRRLFVADPAAPHPPGQ